jgi:DNA-binding MurR/RpiR family transcriptional regulator
MSVQFSVLYFAFMPGSYAERIREARPTLSKSFQRLADYILDSYVQAALMTASELAQAVDVDSATVVRFAQALDYDGFPQLQDNIRARVLQDLSLRPKETATPDSLPALTDRSLRELGEAIERARKLMDTAPLDALLTALDKSKRVLVLADSYAQFILEEVLRHLQAVDIFALVIPADENLIARALAQTGEGDMLLAFDLMNQDGLIPAALMQAKTAGLRGAAIVGSASFDAARRAEIVLEVQRQEKDDNAAVVLSALVHTLGNALRWRFANRYKETQAKAEKVLKRLAAGRPTH